MAQLPVQLLPLFCCISFLTAKNSYSTLLSAYISFGNFSKDSEQENRPIVFSRRAMTTSCSQKNTAPSIAIPQESTYQESSFPPLLDIIDDEEFYANVRVDWEFRHVEEDETDKICGTTTRSQPRKKEQFRIYRGADALPGQWPWTAALAYQKSNGDTRYRCGGTLITTKHVLTAAHCCQVPHQLQDGFELKGVMLGVTDLRINNTGQFKFIDTVRVHEHYDANTHENDIAIISLQESIRFSDNIRAACMPLNMQEPILNSKDTYVAGWGALHHHGGQPSVLQWAQVPLLNLSLCQQAYKDMNQTCDTRMLCAGYLDGSKDACEGDSGGPLVWRDEATYYVIGVVSYGYECGRPGFPGVYVRVANYTAWLTEAIYQML